MTASRILTGALAGLAATGPMTWAMDRMLRALPRRERYPLPPAEIMEIFLGRLGVRSELTAREREALILLGHYGYGAMSGAAYAALTPAASSRPLLRGIGFGLLLWATSYLGWLPLLGILSPATRHPRGRNALMLAAHALWGLVAGALLARQPDAPGGPPDAVCPSASLSPTR